MREVFERGVSERWGRGTHGPRVDRQRVTLGKEWEVVRLKGKNSREPDDAGRTCCWVQAIVRGVGRVGGKGGES